jgi:hypothetical protein
MAKIHRDRNAVAHPSTTCPQPRKEDIHFFVDSLAKCGLTEDQEAVLILLFKYESLGEPDDGMVVTSTPVASTEQI